MNCCQLFYNAPQIRSNKLTLQEFVSAFIRNNCFCQPIQRSLFFQQKRFRYRINIQKPKPYFYYKAQVMKFVWPYYKHPYEGLDYKDVCLNKEVKQFGRTLTPYEEILVREFREHFEQSKMVALLHKNSVSINEEFDFKVLLHKEGMQLKMINNLVMEFALKDTKFEAVLQLLKPNIMCIFSQNTNVKALEKILKKYTQYALLAGIFEDRLLSRNEFLQYGKMDLTSARAGLVQLLQSAGGNNLDTQLTHHQRTLLSHLKQIGTNESAGDPK